MSRLLVDVLIAALLAFWLPALPQHVHASADHGHSEHQHGLASHDHDHPHARVHVVARHAVNAVPHLEACSPDAHVIGVGLCLAAAGPRIDITPAAVSPKFVAPVRRTSIVSPIRADVRVHGPPSAAGPATLRAPPSIPLA